MPEDDSEDEELEDVSDPPVLSDDVCPGLLKTLDTDPEGHLDVLDHDLLQNSTVGMRRRGRCYRSR